MNQLRNEEDVAQMLAGDRVSLFIFVDWSEFARCGVEIFKEAEAKLAAKLPHGPVSWWIADISSTTSSLSSALHRWLTSQEESGKVRMFPNIAMGNGSVIWAKNGEVVKFEPSALRAGLEALVQRTEEILAHS